MTEEMVDDYTYHLDPEWEKLDDDKIKELVAQLLEDYDGGAVEAIKKMLYEKERFDLYNVVYDMNEEANEDMLDRMESQMNRGYEYSKCDSKSDKCRKGECGCGW